MAMPRFLLVPRESEEDTEGRVLCRGPWKRSAGLKSQPGIEPCLHWGGGGGGGAETRWGAGSVGMMGHWAEEPIRKGSVRCGKVTGGCI